jgi:ABC-2 type transport system ATP-binding protein
MSGLELRSVRKTFSSGAGLADATFTVPSGALLGLIGPNGAGKTTTMRTIVGILEPDAGELLWDGRPVGEAPRAQLGYLPEERGLYARMRVAEQVSFFAELREIDADEARDLGASWLERLGLAEHADRETSELSKGNQQKVQLLAAIAHRPRLVILDEPFSGLDPINHELFGEVVRDLHAGGTTIVLSSHDMEHVESLCDSVALIHDGHVSFSGTLQALRERHAAGDDAPLREIFLAEVGAS